MNACTPMEVRELEKLIASLAYKCGTDVSRIFDDFLIYIIHGFSPGEKALENWKYEKEQVAMFYKMYTEWVLIMKRQVCLSGWYDAFGELYMSCIAGNARKQSNGQFFTPAHICDLMAELCGSQDNSVELCGDPACGSGRNLLAWHVKHLSSYLCAEDIDRTCCLMTVCNFLIDGCVGEVIWHDSLNPDTYYDGWKVNERLAITGLPTIRRIAKEESVVWRTWQNQRDDAKGHVITPLKKINIRKKREEARRMQLDLFD